VFGVSNTCHAPAHLEKLIFEGDNDMSNSWDDRRRALEEEYIERQNKAALESLARKSESPLTESPLISPISGKPMTREQILGVTIDRCTESGGIWLDKGELEALLDRASQGDTIDQSANQSTTVNWLQQFWLSVTGK